MNDMRGRSSFLKKRGVQLAAICWLLLALVIVLNREDIWDFVRPYSPFGRIEYTPPPALGDAGPGAGYLRHPIRGIKYAHQTMLAKRQSDNGPIRFTIDAEKGDGLEVGLVRLSGPRHNSGEYVFNVYELLKGKRKKLLETSGEFPVDKWTFFRINNGLAGRNDGTTEIQYTIRRKGWKGKIASIFSRGKEGDGLYQNFAFLKPNLLNKRKQGELNVILISFDTLRADHLGCYGYPRDTSPNIDDFARKSVMFSQAISPQPQTIPAHRSLFTGLYPMAHGYQEKVGGWDEFIGIFRPLYPHATLASVLRDNGYYTAAFTGGGTISSEFGFARGFNVYEEFCSFERIDDPKLMGISRDNDTKKIFDNAIQWLKENSDLKFFMFVHTFECHSPYEGTYFLSDDSASSLIEQRKALYDGDIRIADSHFGRLMQAVDSLNLLSDTVILFVSDHGDDLYDHYRESDWIPPIPKDLIIPQVNRIDHGHSLYDELIHVPLIVYIPGIEPPKRIIGNQVQLTDVMPTILQLLGIEYEGPVNGTSILELMMTGRRNEDPPALGECGITGENRKSIRKDGYKYIWTKDPARVPPSGVTLRNLHEHELFNLKSDPKEKINIYDENKELGAEYDKILKEQLEATAALKNRLQTMNKQTDEESTRLSEDVYDSVKALGYLQ